MIACFCTLWCTPNAVSLSRYISYQKQTTLMVRYQGRATLLALPVLPNPFSNHTRQRLSPHIYIRILLFVVRTQEL